MSEKSQESSPNERILLKEYELCQRAADNLEATVWQTSAAIGVGMIVTFFLVASHPLADQPPWQVAALLGAFMTFASFIWWLMARRWWSIQHAFYLRMHHIEEDLQMYSVRYVSYLDDPTELSNSDLAPERIKDLERRARKR